MTGGTPMTQEPPISTEMAIFGVPHVQTAAVVSLEFSLVSILVSKAPTDWRATITAIELLSSHWGFP